MDAIFSQFGDDYNWTYLYDYDDYYDFGNYTVFSEYDFHRIIASPSASYVIAWIVIWIGFPLTLLAIYALYSLVREDHVAPVYVINLLFSDLIQMCCFVVWVARPRTGFAFYVSRCVYFIGVMASVGFMVCVALERYLVVACPLWYRFRRSIKISVWVSISVWTLSLMEFLTALLISHSIIFRCVFLLVPFPLLIFFLVGTLRALSAAISLPVKEKRRIVGTLVLVLLNYTVLFLPWVIWLLLHGHFSHDVNDSGFYLSFLQFSPLADLILYVFMRKGAVDKLLARLCCERMTREEDQGQAPSTDPKDTEVSSV